MSPLNSACSSDEADRAAVEHAAHSLSELTKNNIVFHKIYSLAKVSVCTSSSLKYVFVVVSYLRNIFFFCFSRNSLLISVLMIVSDETNSFFNLKEKQIHFGLLVVKELQFLFDYFWNYFL